jgi:hypothetical protein
MELDDCCQRDEGVSLGLKPGFVVAPDARTEVRAYLRSNGRSKGKA